VDQEVFECDETCQFLVCADDDNVLTETKCHKKSIIILLEVCNEIGLETCMENQVV
jgi:hypothetical protein